MTTTERSSARGVAQYLVLDVPAWIKGAAVVLVCTNEPIEARRVLALRPDEAERLHQDGLLDGWISAFEEPPFGEETSA